MRFGLRWNLDRFLLLTLLSFLLVGGLRVVTLAAEPGTQSSRPPASPHEPVDGGEYRFHQTDSSGNPIGWNPCKPIPYWIGSQNLPGGGTNLISWVLAEVTAISGQQFDFQGYTHAVPADDDPFPVDGAWIGWTTATSTDSWVGHELDGPDPAIGLASRTYGSGRWTNRGWAMLLSDYNPQPDAAAGGVLRHEVGHMLGLDHTTSPDEVMTPGGPSQHWGPGDRRGLWLLGPSGGCE